MRILVMAMLTLIVCGCAPGVDHLPLGDPLCEATARARTEHAAALAKDGGPRSVTTGRGLLATIDVGCMD